MTLNPSQQAAVNHQGSHLLIIAGPGTGKTHTLTYRIARLASQLKENERILAITFTNKAALEMKHRLSKLCGKRIEKIFVGTFHSFCFQLLQEHSHFKDFCVALPEEIENLVKDLWPQYANSQRKNLLEKISRWKSIDFDKEPPAEIAVYNNSLRTKNLFDFDDLLLESLSLISCHSSRLQDYRYIFVDEYQDINAVQHRLLLKLVSPQLHLTAIGDPNQAIYGFRGSDVRFFESFREDFPGATTLFLEENYRSAPNLLTASGQVMAKTKFSFVPALTAKIYQEGRLIIYEAPTDKAEAEYVVHKIEKMVGGTSMFSHDSGRAAKHEEAHYTFGDMAVLYRLNTQKNLLKEALERSGIPYEISGDKSLEGELLPQANDKYVERSEKVSLMTLHTSKGLEFSVVFIIGCEENLSPLNLENFKADIEEERRLFYVGMTRAKEQLYLVRAQRRMLFGKTYENSLSPFLTDIEEELQNYERETIKKISKEDKQLQLFKSF